MRDPEVTRPGLPAAYVPAIPRPPGSAYDPVADHYPADTRAPAAVAPRRRWRWAVFTLVAVVVAGLAAGLVAWAPWTPPPVLRPTGLVAGHSTANSITFRWAHPGTGPLPDKYLILSDGRMAGTVAGTVTSYRQAGLTPASTYKYSVVAIRGGKRSPQSAPLAVSTRIPPVSRGRLQGSWNVYGRNIRRVKGSRDGTMRWHFIPACASGDCNVVAHVKGGKYSFKVTLTRMGRVYRAHAKVNLPCGPRGNTIPDPVALKVRIRVNNALAEGHVWAADSLVGTMAGTSEYVSSATFYCPASSFKATLSGSPVRLGLSTQA